jgi:hypothetical protein
MGILSNNSKPYTDVGDAKKGHKHEADPMHTTQHHHRKKTGNLENHLEKSELGRARS